MWQLFNFLIIKWVFLCVFVWACVCLCERVCVCAINTFVLLTNIYFHFNQASKQSKHFDSMTWKTNWMLIWSTANNPPASKANREVANLTERKNHVPPYMVSKNLSVCLSLCVKLWPQLSQHWQKRIGYLIFHLSRTKKYLKKSLQLWPPELFL